MSMKTKKTNLKAIALSFGLVAMMAPATLNAQINHGLLNDPYNDNSNMNHGLFNQQGNRSGGNEEWDLNVGFQTFKDPAPLGSGIVILIGAGLGYVALKKKEDEQ